MTDTTTTAASSDASSAALGAMKLAQLQALAVQLGVKGTSRMRKGDVLAAIRAHQSGQTAASPSSKGADSGAPAQRADAASGDESSGKDGNRDRSRRRDNDAQKTSDAESPGDQRESVESRDGSGNRDGGRDKPDARDKADTRDRDGNRGDNRERGENRDRDGKRDRDGRDNQRQRNRDNQNRDNQNRDNQGDDGGNRGRDGDGQGDNRRDRNDRNERNRNRNDRNNGPDDDDDDGRGRRRGRYRDRKRRGRGGNDPMGADEPEVREDDVLLPVAGILDVLDNYAFVRTSGYLPGPNDVYVSLAQVRKNGLRKGDAVTGAVRQPRDGDNQGGGGSNRQKFNALVRLDTVNGQSPEEARQRPDFGKLTPLYPQERLRLETTPTNYTNRVIDLVSPIGKGQRALIVSPPKAGKTMVMQSIANAITANNPECHLMVVLVDERPEEVTDFSRSVDGEVIASTFDRPASDHTMIAELAIERAKRLVELGHDVVVLLDGITRLGRAYNLAAPASGRIMSGGVDSSALYPPKKFFGAARNIEGGGSLTIMATALVETGSKMDEVIFEEFKGTGNSELRLSRSLADKRVFPAVDVNPSGTRREEILISREELAVMWKLRRVLAALDSNQALELLLNKLKETKSNTEFLMQVARSTPGMWSEKD